MFVTMETKGQIEFLKLFDFRRMLSATHIES